jgi:hypothetical protein
MIGMSISLPFSADFKKESKDEQDYIYGQIYLLWLFIFLYLISSLISWAIFNVPWLQRNRDQNVV